MIWMTVGKRLCGGGSRRRALAGLGSLFSFTRPARRAPSPPQRRFPTVIQIIQVILVIIQLAFQAYKLNAVEQGCRAAGMIG